MKIREDLEKQIDKAKVKLQKQWVIEQIREKKQKFLQQAHSRNWSMHDYEQSWDKDKDLQTRNYSNL